MFPIWSNVGFFVVVGFFYTTNGAEHNSAGPECQARRPGRMGRCRTGFVVGLKMLQPANWRQQAALVPARRHRTGSSSSQEVSSQRRIDSQMTLDAVDCIGASLAAAVLFQEI